MVFLQALRHSIKLPAKEAMFKLNRIGMDITVVYMFILLLIVSMPSLLDRLLTPSETGLTVHFFFLIMYFFIFYYLPLVIFVFIMLAATAYVGVLISRGLSRKIRFSILWKMCAYTTTIPFIIYTFVALLTPISDRWLWLFLVYTVILMVKIITVYPRRKKRRKK
ncbi:DUF1189 family protein [Lentibacillus sp. N15]|uniref:DUF1189 family protein n=1 Tax=Lentibacillus songyuanensis TaxID=3136161 RepID=UPI0031BBB255